MDGQRLDVQAQLTITSCRFFALETCPADAHFIALPKAAPGFVAELYLQAPAAGERSAAGERLAAAFARRGSPPSRNDPREQAPAAIDHGSRGRDDQWIERIFQASASFDRTINCALTNCTGAPSNLPS